MKGQQTMHHNAGMFNNTWSDMAIETTFMRYGHDQSCVTGLTLKRENSQNLGIQLACMQQYRERLDQG